MRFGKRTAKAIWDYLKDRMDSADPTQPLVLVDELTAPHAMNRNVLRRLLKHIGDRRLEKRASPSAAPFFRDRVSMQWWQDAGTSGIVGAF